MRLPFTKEDYKKHCYEKDLAFLESTKQSMIQAVYASLIWMIANCFLFISDNILIIYKCFFVKISLILTVYYYITIKKYKANEQIKELAKAYIARLIMLSFQIINTSIAVGIGWLTKNELISMEAIISIFILTIILFCILIVSSYFYHYRVMETEKQEKKLFWTLIKSISIVAILFLVNLFWNQRIVLVGVLLIGIFLILFELSGYLVKW